MNDSIEAAALEMNAARLAVEYAMSMAEKVMETKKLAGQELIQLLPAIPVVGQHIDTYA